MLTRKGLQATDGQSSAPPRCAAEWQDGGHQGWTVFEIPSTPGSSHPSDRSSAVKIRCVATGVILVRHLIALLGGERLPTMARARPRLFRCSRTHSCPRRALDASCSKASCYRRRDRQDITQAQNLHAWARCRCSCHPWRAAPPKLAPCTPLFLSFPGSSAATLLRLHLPN